LKYDPTRFSEISEAYDNIVRSLLASTADNLPEGVRPQELEKFKQIYTDSAFICRYRGCERYSDGFSTSAERDEHEKMHEKFLRCSDPTCEFWARGFTSRTGLQKHNRKYHPSPDELPLPEFKPRKEEVLLMSLPPKVPRPILPPPKEQRKRGLKGQRVHRCDQCGKV
jgi:hypothetical protein